MVMILTLPMGAFAADTKPVAKSKLTTTELKIANAYLKTVTTLNPNNMDSVKYPGLKYSAAGTIPTGFKLGILRPTFTKVKDKSGLNRIDLSGLMVMSDGEKLVTFNITSGILLKAKGSKLYSWYEIRGKEEQKVFGDLSFADQNRVFDWLEEQFDADVAFALTTGEVEEDTNVNEDKASVPATSTSSNSAVKTLIYNDKDYGDPKLNNTAAYGQWGKLTGIDVLGATFDVELRVVSSVKDNEGYAKLFPDTFAANSDKFDFYRVEMEGKSYNFKNASDKYVSMLAPSDLTTYGRYSGGKVVSYQKEFDGGFGWQYALSNSSAITGTYSSLNSPSEIYSKGVVYLASVKGKSLEYVEINKGLKYYFFKVK